MNEEIKVGDVVRLLNNNRHQYSKGLIKGKKYIVSNVFNNGKIIQIRYSVYLINVFREDVELSEVEETNNDKDIKDNVNSPSHYTQGKYETIELIEDIVEDFASYCIGNVVKYVSRYKHKNGIEDLEKAKKYLEFLIEKEND